MAEQIDKHSPFLSLSTELRNRIYQFALVEEQPIDISIHNPVGPTDTATFYVTEPALLRTSRQLRREASLAFYGGNVFRSELLGHMEPWLGALSVAKLGMLNDIRPHETSMRVVMSNDNEAMHAKTIQMAQWVIRRYGRGVLRKSVVGFPVLQGGQKVWLTAEDSL